jgi:hypothetical protein
MNFITIKTFMHMHIQTKCFNLICQLDFDLKWKKQKNSKIWFTNWQWWIIKNFLWWTSKFTTQNWNLETIHVNLFLQHHFNVMYTSSPIHLKDDAKQKKDKKTTNISKTQLKGENFLLMGALAWLLQVERKICHCGPPTMAQHSSSTFTISLEDFPNNHFNCWDQLLSIAPKHDNLYQQVEKHCWIAIHDRRNCGLWF